MASTPKGRFAAFLARDGRTVTEHMSRVVDAALGHSGSFSHEDILAALERNVSRATAYRTLAKMVEAGVLQQSLLHDRELFVLAADHA